MEFVSLANCTNSGGAIIRDRGFADFLLAKSRRARVHKIPTSTLDLPDGAILRAYIDCDRFQELFMEYLRKRTPVTLRD